MKRHRNEWLDGWPFLVLGLVLLFVSGQLGAFRDWSHESQPITTTSTTTTTTSTTRPGVTCTLPDGSQIHTGTSEAAQLRCAP